MNTYLKNSLLLLALFALIYVPVASAADSKRKSQCAQVEAGSKILYYTSSTPGGGAVRSGKYIYCGEGPCLKAGDGVKCARKAGSIEERDGTVFCSDPEQKTKSEKHCVEGKMGKCKKQRKQKSCK